MMDAKTKKKGYVWFSLVGILAVLFTSACSELAVKGNIIWNFSWILKWVGLSVVLGILCGVLLFFFCVLWKEKVSDCIKLPGYLIGECSAGRTFGISFGVLFLCWFPVWLAYYPGICSYDIPAQMTQILTGQYNTHHPLIHTLLMEGFYRLGNIAGNDNLGIGLYTFLQMVVLAGTMAGMIAVWTRWKLKRWQGILLTLYCALLPVNGYMSITTTKDIFFAIFVIWFFVGIYVYLNKEEKCTKVIHPLLIVAAAGVCLFRNNGKYALAVIWGVLAIMLLCNAMKKRKLRKWMGLFTDISIGLIGGCLVAACLAKGLNASPGDKREMLSMPIQQLARTFVYHGGAGILPEDDNTMENQDKELIKELFLNESYKYYRPEISDPVKRHTNTYVVRYRTGEFVKTYLNLLREYPGDFINAALEVNAGWFSLTDKSHATINQFEIKEGFGYIQTNWSKELGGTNLYQDSKWPWLRERMNSFADNNTYLQIPLVRYLVAPGIYLWGYLLLAIWLLLHKKYNDLLPFTWVLGYYGTLILGPTVQMRYLYPLMIAFPFFLIYVGKQTGSIKRENV